MRSILCSFLWLTCFSCSLFSPALYILLLFLNSQTRWAYLTWFSYYLTCFIMLFLVSMIFVVDTSFFLYFFPIYSAEELVRWVKGSQTNERSRCKTRFPHFQPSNNQLQLWRGHKHGNLKFLFRQKFHIWLAVVSYKVQPRILRLTQVIGPIHFMSVIWEFTHLIVVLWRNEAIWNSSYQASFHGTCKCICSLWTVWKGKTGISASGNFAVLTSVLSKSR